MCLQSSPEVKNSEGAKQSIVDEVTQLRGKGSFIFGNVLLRAEVKNRLRGKFSPFVRGMMITRQKGVQNQRLLK